MTYGLWWPDAHPVLCACVSLPRLPRTPHAPHHCSLPRPPAHAPHRCKGRDPPALLPALPPTSPQVAVGTWNSARTAVSQPFYLSRLQLNVPIYLDQQELKDFGYSLHKAAAEKVTYASAVAKMMRQFKLTFTVGVRGEGVVEPGKTSTIGFDVGDFSQHAAGTGAGDGESGEEPAGEEALSRGSLVRVTKSGKLQDKWAVVQSLPARPFQNDDFTPGKYGAAYGANSQRTGFSVELPPPSARDALHNDGAKARGVLSNAGKAWVLSNVKVQRRGGKDGTWWYYLNVNQLRRSLRSAGDTDVNNYHMRYDRANGTVDSSEANSSRKYIFQADYGLNATLDAWIAVKGWRSFLKVVEKCGSTAGLPLWSGACSLSVGGAGRGTDG